jgi:hypothetical protein
MVGGILEYVSLITGYRALLVLVVVLYAAAFGLQRFQAGRVAQELSAGFVA